MNRAERRRKGVTNNGHVLKCTEETLSGIRTDSANAIRKAFIATFLLSVYDELEFKSFKNKRGKLDRVYEDINHRLDKVDDILDYRFSVDLFKEVKDKTGITILVDAEAKTYFNGLRDNKKQYMITHGQLKDIMFNSKTASLPIYLGVFVLSIGELYDLHSGQMGVSSSLDRLIDRFHMKIECLAYDKAPATFQDYMDVLRDEVGMAI